MTKREVDFIKQCLAEIEIKLNWGSSENWKQRDFEALIDLIFDKTKVQLSLSTIKRIWQLNFKQLPQANTLNALAQFLGYTNWQDYKSSSSTVVKEENKIPDIQFRKRRVKKKNSLILILGLAACIGAIYWLGYFGKKPDISAENISFDSIVFTSESISDNIPNTVMFRYKLPRLETDSIFIQQSWDRRRREKVSGNDSVHTSIYYYPGYFITKLLVNDSIVKEEPLHITTNGWQALATETGMDDIPSYIPQDRIFSNGNMYVSPSLLKEYNVNLKEVSHWVHYINSQDFGNLNCRNFILETSVKNALTDGALTCQEAYVQIHFESGFSLFPLSIPGCFSNLKLKYSDYFENGKKNDLSMFGCDMNQWQHLKIIAKDELVKVFLNNQEIKSFRFQSSMGKIKYIQYRFKGCGKVDLIHLSDTSGNLIYQEEF